MKKNNIHKQTAFYYYETEPHSYIAHNSRIHIGFNLIPIFIGTMYLCGSNKLLLLLAAGIFFLSTCTLAQDSARINLNMSLGYYLKNNEIQYLVVDTKTRIEGKFQPVKNVTVDLYLVQDSGDIFINKVVTDERGKAKSFLPVLLKPAWDASYIHSFKAVAEAGKKFDEATADLTIARSRIEIDTGSDEGSKNISATVSEFKNGSWLPVKDVDVKIGVTRLGGILAAGEEEFYTTDEEGHVTATFNKNSLPGDDKENITLIAWVEDNDQFGNIKIEKIVPWGIAHKADNTFFNQRTLWSTRNYAPTWLLFIAFSIIIGVWGTLFYLILQIFRIRKLGTGEVQAE